MVNFVFILAMLCSGTSVDAQIDYKIGNGTVSNTRTGLPSPLHDYYMGDRHQFLYKKEELTAMGMQPGNIVAIKWDVVSVNSPVANPQGWAMHIGTTSVTALTTTFQATPSYLVYGPASDTYTPTNGVNTYPLATPFYWDGTSNILIQTCHGIANDLNSYTSNASVNYTTVSFNATTYYQADNSGNLCGVTSGTALTNRPNIIFTWKAACSGKVITPPANVSLCETDSTIFTAAVDSVHTYRWQLNTGAGWVNLVDGPNYSGTTNDSLVVKNTTMAMHNYQYRLAATNTVQSCTVNTTEAKLSMIPTSAASVVISAAPDTQLCKNEEITLMTAFTNGGSTPQYRWLRNGILIPGEVNASLVTTTLNDGDIIQCRFISSAQCVFPLNSDPIEFEVDPISQTAVDLHVSYNGNNSYTFTATPQNGGSNPKYYWYVNNKMVAGQNGNTYTVQDLLPFEKVTVGMLTSLDCAEPKLATSAEKTTSINEMNDAKNGIVLAPNPNKGSFTISSANFEASSVIVTVTNTVGQVLYKSNVETHGELNHTIDLGNITPGMYVLLLEAEGTSIQKRFSVTE